MATVATGARQLGRTFAQAVRDIEQAKTLWVRACPEHVELWLLTDSIRAELERELHRRSTLLYERFPDVDFELHILNPAHSRSRDLTRLVPSGAEEIPLRVD